VILADLSFAVPAEGITVLMGPAGTGKSTLLRALAAMLQANARYRDWGRLSYQGRLLTEHHRPALVVQNPRLLGARVFDTLAERLRQLGLALSAQDQKARIHAAFAAWGCEDLLPLLGQTALQLSLGQQRRVAIVGELLQTPGLLMLDEPTANLADDEAQSVLALVQRIAERLPVLMILHHQQQARTVAQRILLLAGGRIQADADVSRFFDRPPNPVAAQFVRTGSCNVASPDAPADTLDEAVPAPPPLPERARPPAPLPVPAPAPEAAAPTPAPIAAPAPAPRPEAEPTPAPLPDDIPASPEILQAQPGQPLPLSVLIAVEAVAEYRGPRGFHWIVPGRIGTAPLPGAVIDIRHDLDALRTVGVTMLITLTRGDLPQDALAAHGLKNLHLPIYDREAPSINQLRMLAVRITRLIQSGEVLAVHCRAGLGRTGTVVAGWLIHEGLTADAALARIRSIDKDYVQTAEQEEFLHKLELSFLMRV
jgi:atypical dual specificity phosphatase